MKQHDFKTEAELCETVIGAVREWGHKVWPETCGYDFVIGVQDHYVGVEAKLRANTKVLHQGHLHLRQERRADVVAVLVPVPDSVFTDLALALRLWPIFPHYFKVESRWCQDRFREEVVLRAGAGAPQKLRPPEFVVEIPAGVPSPRTVSAWKLNAVRLSLRLAGGEVVTRPQIKEANQDYSTWWSRGWVERANTGRPALYRLGSNPKSRLPHLEYPEIVAALAGEDRK